MVIYPTGKDWSNAPEIEEGATVHKDQILLLMPDLSKMQVKVGIHESIVDRIKPGLSATVTMPGRSLEGDISYVAAVTKPAGWWTGNVVKYDTIVELPEVDGLKPGMTVQVEVVMARHKDVLLVPTTAVLETENGHVCWVKQGNKTTRRSLKLGDSSDMFILVEAGLTEGEEVVLDPLANVEEAQTEAAKSLDSGGRRRPTDDEPEPVSAPPVSD